MPIQRGITNYDKRLKILKSQHFGGLETGIETHNPQTDVKSDVTFLKQDLIKISVLTSLAIGIQIVLFFTLKNGLLKLPI